MGIGTWIVVAIVTVLVAATVLAYALARNSDDQEEDR